MKGTAEKVQERKEGAEKVGSLLSLNAYFTMVEQGQIPTIKQKFEALDCYIKFLGANSETQILNCGKDFIIDSYREVKEKILNTGGVAENEQNHNHN